MRMNVRSGLLTAALGTLACGSEASVRMKDGVAREGVILRSDAQTLTFEGGATVNRADVTDIDHPGNGAAITGGALIAYGILNGMLVESQISDKDFEGDKTPARLGGWAPLAVGLALLPYGYFIWNRSVEAAGGGGGAGGSSAFVPRVSPGAYGGAVGGQF